MSNTQLKTIGISLLVCSALSAPVAWAGRITPVIKLSPEMVEVESAAFRWMAIRSVGLVRAYLTHQVSELSPKDQTRFEYLQIDRAQISPEVSARRLDGLTVRYLHENIQCVGRYESISASSEDKRLKGECTVRLASGNENASQDTLKITIERTEDGLPELSLDLI